MHCLREGVEKGEMIDLVPLVMGILQVTFLIIAVIGDKKKA